MRQLKITKQITNRDSKSLEKYLQEVAKIEMSTAEEEVELAKRIKQGDQAALNKLVNANLRFVVSAAKQYQGRGLKLSDLINEGNYGLVKAAKRFDETRGFKFISYAVWWIRQSIIQAISEHSRVIRTPQNKIQAMGKIKRVSTRLEQKLERPPSAPEIAAELDMDVDKVKTTIKKSARHLYMDAPLQDEGASTRYSVMASKDSLPPDQNVMRESMVSDIEDALDTLPEREGNVVRMYFGIGEKTPLSLHEIGDVYDITKERVRQIKEKGLRTLRHRSRSKSLQAYL